MDSKNLYNTVNLNKHCQMYKNNCWKNSQQSFQAETAKTIFQKKTVKYE